MYVMDMYVRQAIELHVLLLLLLWPWALTDYTDTSTGPDKAEVKMYLHTKKQNFQVTASKKTDATESTTTSWVVKNSSKIWAIFWY